MYDAEFSRQLSQSWACVYELEKDSERVSAASRRTSSNQSNATVTYNRMEQTYMDAIKLLETPTDARSVEGRAYIDRVEKVTRVLMQNGRYSAAVELAERLIAFSESAVEMAEEAERQSVELWHAGFIYLKAKVFDEEMRSQDYMYQSHIPKLMILVESFEKAIAVFQKLAPDDERLGKCLNRVGFHYSGIAMRNGSEKIPRDEAQRMSVKRVEDAIQFYTRSENQPVNLADCYITRGVCEGGPTQNQIDFYLKGLKLAIEHVGLFHPILDRAYLNIGIFYEDQKNTNEAYAYFRKWFASLLVFSSSCYKNIFLRYQLLVAVYGQSHPRTLRAVRILNERVYQRLAASLGHIVPTAGLHLDNDDEHIENTTEGFGPIQLEELV